MSDDNKQPNSEEIRAKVIETFEIDDNDDNYNLIEKLTTKEIENQKNLSKTIEQKAKYRDLAIKNGIIDPETFEPIDKKPDGNSLKNNQEQTSIPTMEHAMLFGRGATLEKVKVAEKIAAMEGISLSEAFESDLAKIKFAQMDNEAKIKSNSVGASYGSPSPERKKTVSNMTDEEHRQFAQEKLAQAVNM